MSTALTRAARSWWRSRSKLEAFRCRIAAVAAAMLLLVGLVTSHLVTSLRAQGESLQVLKFGKVIDVEALDIGIDRIREGDAVLVSGPVGDHGIAVMRHTVTLILGIDLAQARHHALHARGPEHRRGLGVARRHPALQQQLAQTIQMVGMEMGQENRVDLAVVHAHLAQVAGG